jgi:YHS domain-containing protein
MRHLPSQSLLALFAGTLFTGALLVGCSRSDAAPTVDAASPGAPANVSPGAAKADGPAAAGHQGEACNDTCGSAHDAATDGAAHACGDEASKPVADAASLRRVPSEQVCMRSNRFQQNRPQISTEVDGHTYFGCCAGCAKGLQNDAAARTAKDPVSGHSVDKATAVIGARPDGSVVYFESEETFTRAGGA